jgi:hypothetical protein
MNCTHMLNSKILSLVELLVRRTTRRDRGTSQAQSRQRCHSRRAGSDCSVKTNIPALSCDRWSQLATAIPNRGIDGPRSIPRYRRSGASCPARWLGDEPLSRSTLLFEHDLRANRLRLMWPGKTSSAFLGDSSKRRRRCQHAIAGDECRRREGKCRGWRNQAAA